MMFILIWTCLLFSVRSNPAFKDYNITGNTTVKEGVEDVTKCGSNKNHKGIDLQNNTGTNLMNDTGAKLKEDTGPKGGTEKQNKTVSNHTVNSTITVSVTDHSNTTIKCVSSNDIDEAKVNEDDQLSQLLRTVKQPQVIIAFLTGILLSAIICCLARTCQSKKQKSSGNLAETLEMETVQVVSLIDAGQTVEDDGTHNQEAAGQSAPYGDVEPKEVEYSDIDFSRFKSPAEKTQDTTESEYAEIKREQTEERQDNGGEEGEMLGKWEGNEEEEMMIEKDKETKQCIPAAEDRGEDVAI